MKQVIAVVLTLIFVFWVIGASQPEPSYENTWQSDGNITVARALTKAQLKGCGFFVYKKRSDSTGVYLVRCGFEDETQTYYKLWTAIGEAEGPFYSEDHISE